MTQSSTVQCWPGEPQASVNSCRYISKVPSIQSFYIFLFPVARNQPLGTFVCEVIGKTAKLWVSTKGSKPLILRGMSNFPTDKHCPWPFVITLPPGCIFTLVLLVIKNSHLGIHCIPQLNRAPSSLNFRSWYSELKGLNVTKNSIKTPRVKGKKKAFRFSWNVLVKGKMENTNTTAFFLLDATTISTFWKWQGCQPWMEARSGFLYAKWLENSVFQGS